MRKYPTLEPSTLMEEEECRGIYPLIKKIHSLAQSFTHLINISFIFILNFANTVIESNSTILHRVQYTPFKYIGNEASATKTTTNAGWRSSRRRRNKLRLPRLI